MWQRVQAGLNAVIQPAAEGRMTGPISATCCPRPLPPFHLLRVPKGAVLSKQDEVFRKRPHCELVSKFLICNETVEMALGKENCSKHGPQICGQCRRKYSTVEFWSWQDLPLESCSFYLCDPDLVNFIQPQYSHVQDWNY